MDEIDYEMLQYISGFIDGKFYAIDQIYKSKQKMLPTEELTNWYTKGYNDANNYYVNMLLDFKTINAFLVFINNQDINPIIQEQYANRNINLKK